MTKCVYIQGVSKTQPLVPIFVVLKVCFFGDALYIYVEEKSTIKNTITRGKLLFRSV